MAYTVTPFFVFSPIVSLGSMSNKREQSKLKAFISNLMQGKSEEEIMEAEQNFYAYLELVRDIQQKTHSEKDSSA